jgi:hypothetical protein
MARGWRWQAGRVEAHVAGGDPPARIPWKWRRAVNAPQHQMTCHLILHPEKLDRFFLDMKVYNVELHPFDGPDGARSGASLIWRGIYLAVEVQPAPRMGSSTK